MIILLIQTVVSYIGSACFGLVVGWMACRVHHEAKMIDLKWLAAMLTIIGGGAVTAIFNVPALFGAYSIGLAIGFFSRPLVLRLDEKAAPKAIEESES